MDVKCPSCQAEYEFDDALVSERGTTVRCTNCGHQFKVRRSGGASSDVDRWVVTSPGGQQLVLTSLRELQRAILQKQVSRGDLLARGGESPRPLGSIVELEPFFQGRTSRPPATVTPLPDEPRLRMATIPPTGSVPPPAMTLPSARPGFGSGATEVDDNAATMTAQVPPPPVIVQGPGAAVGVAPVILAGTPGPAADEFDDEARTLRRASPDAAPARSPSTPPPPPAQRISRPPPAPPVRSSRPPPAPTGPTSSGRASTPPPPSARISRAPASIDLSSPLPPPTITVETPLVPSAGPDSFRRGSLPPSSGGLASLGPPPRRVGGWVIAAVLLLGVGAVALGVARPYLQRTAATTPVTNLDPKAQAFFVAGERAMADGNLELAQESFDKAGALADKDPQILLAVARVAAAKADVAWMRVRLLAPEAAEDLRVTKANLDELATRARKAADDATAVLGETDGAAVRARADGLRLAGERDAARVLVPRLAAGATSPETAYVLAALDLAEAEPLWPQVLDRLRLAAASEGNGGRARVALAYALSRSGDNAAARAELERVAALPRPHPLLPALRAFVERGSGSRDGGVTPGSSSARPPVTGGPTTAVPPAAPQGGAFAGGVGLGGGGDVPSSMDPRMALQQAERAYRAGDYERSRTFYEAALTKNPRDSEALAGLGDVARAQRDFLTAKTSYRQALGVNPSYLPAMLGLGDVQWESGDKGAAQQTYKDIAERFPETSYPSRVKTRLEAAPSPAPPPSPAPSTAAPASPVTAEPSGGKTPYDPEPEP